jgi:hypothetical protein
MASTKTVNEFEGLTATDCCDGCLENLRASTTAQKRLNEIDRLYKRGPSLIQNNETVLEGDAEWLDRVAELDPGIRTEWAQLAAAVGGRCVISGAAYCASPAKGGLHSAQKMDRRHSNASNAPRNCWRTSSTIRKRRATQESCKWNLHRISISR